MGPKVEEVAASAAAPASADVVVIGGGIVGASAALFLAMQGVRTVLCEKGHIAGEQSSRNWGWVRRMGRDPRELPLIVETMKIWSSLRQLVDDDAGYRATGVLYLCASDEELARRESWLQVAGDFALDTRIVRGAKLEEILPGSSRKYIGALYTPSDGRAEPQKAAPAIARGAQKHGAVVLTGCAVRGIETSGGRVSGVITEKGPISCGSVLLAGGAWSSLFCRSLGIRLPQLVVRASVMRTEPLDGPDGAVWGSGFSFRKRLDGGYTIANGLENRYDIVPDSFRYFWDFLPVLKMEWRHVELRFGRPFFEQRHLAGRWRMDEKSPFETVRVLDPDPVDSHLDDARAALARVFPKFANLREAQRWAGLIDATPDTVPVISETAIPGFFIATGFSGHGFGIGPGAGRLVADMIMGKRPLVDPTEFRLTRYSDGSKPRPYTGL